MYRIAICDDEKSTCAEIESYILMYSKLRFIRNEIEVFYSGEAFCEYVKQGNFFDLLFLDIELPAINGIEVGKFVRTSLGDEKMDIIYISSKINYAMQLFQNRPMDFLVKPVKYSAVEMNMDIFGLNHKFCGISDSSRSSVGSYRIASERNIRHQDIRIPVCEES